MNTTFRVSEESPIVGARVTLATVVVSFLSLGMQPGTGGAATADYYRARAAKGYAIAYHSAPAPIASMASVPSVMDQLHRIRSVMKPTVTELSKVLNVSRQTIYSWQDGGEITAENAAKVLDLAKAADVFASVGLSTTNQLLRRKIGGKSFLEKVRDGAAAEEAAQTLLVVSQREHEQRSHLSARLKDRRRPTNPSEDIGMPHLDELG